MGMNPTPIELEPKARRNQNLFRFFSPLADRIVELESFVEYIIWLSMEFNQQVIFLCERPCVLSGKIDGRKQTYKPDLFFRTRELEESLGECKKQEDLIETEPGVWLPKRWPIMSALAEQARYPLKLYIDAELAPYATAVANWREALSYVSDEAQRPRPELRETVLAQFEHVSTLSLGELAASIPDWEPSEVHSASLWWVHQGPLDVEWNRSPLGRETVLTLHSGPDWRRL